MFNNSRSQCLKANLSFLKEENAGRKVLCSTCMESGQILCNTHRSRNIKLLWWVKYHLRNGNRFKQQQKMNMGILLHKNVCFLSTLWCKMSHFVQWIATSANIQKLYAKQITYLRTKYESTVVHVLAPFAISKCVKVWIMPNKFLTSFCLVFCTWERNTNFTILEENKLMVYQKI